MRFRLRTLFLILTTGCFLFGNIRSVYFTTWWNEKFVACELPSAWNLPIAGLGFPVEGAWLETRRPILAAGVSRFAVLKHSNWESPTVQKPLPTKATEYAACVYFDDRNQPVAIVTTQDGLKTGLAFVLILSLAMVVSSRPKI
jgi:hypothetical protein